VLVCTAFVDQKNVRVQLPHIATVGTPTPQQTAPLSRSKNLVYGMCIGELINDVLGVCSGFRRSIATTDTKVTRYMMHTDSQLAAIIIIISFSSYQLQRLHADYS